MHGFGVATSSGSCIPNAHSTASAGIGIVAVDISGSNGTLDGHGLVDRGWTVSPWIINTPSITTSVGGNLNVAGFSSFGNAQTLSAASGSLLVTQASGLGLAITANVQATAGSTSTSATGSQNDNFSAGIVGFDSSVAGGTPLWSGVLDPSRAIDWSQAGVIGVVPSRTACMTPACNTILTPANVDAANINTAIASAPANTVVTIPAGTFTLSAGIDFANHSNVTLRGEGADQTFLKFSGGGATCGGPQADICVQNGDINWPGGPSNSATWTAGYAKGTTQITLSNTASITPGKTFLVLDQCNDGLSGTTCTTGRETDPGTIFVCETVGICSPQDGPAQGERSGRAQQQLVKATAVNGNVVTISPGLYMPNWNGEDHNGNRSPGAWWGNSVVTWDGIENLSIDHTGSNATSGIMFFNAFNCWVKGVRDIDSDRNHVWLQISAHNTVRDSYFYGTKNAASESYGIETYMSSDNLIENNVFQHVASPMMVNGSSSGTVFGYNFAVDDYYSTAGWMMGSNWLHAAGVDSILEEGNQGSGFIADDIHGSHNFVTLFRNRFTGWEATKTVQTTPVHLYTHSRYFNVIGSVLGNSTYHTQYQDLPPIGTNSARSIYTLGWSGNDGGSAANVVNDTFVADSLMRWGNYDLANGTNPTSTNDTTGIRFVSSEVPSGLTCSPTPCNSYANIVPASQTLPASFYLSAQPLFLATTWGTPPWPPIGPDVTSGNIPNVGGHANNVPAQLCHANSPIDTSYQTTYAVTAASWSAGTGTLTLGSGASHLAISNYITISGINPSGYNGSFAISAVDTINGTISYALPSNPGAYVSGGTFAYPNLLLFNAHNCYPNVP